MGTWFSAKRKKGARRIRRQNADEICVPFQFMYAVLSSSGDDGDRLAHAYRFCPCPQHDGHDSVAAAAHEQAEGLDRHLINSWEC